MLGLSAHSVGSFCLREHQPQLNQPELNQPELGSGFKQPELSTLLFGRRKKQLEKETENSTSLSSNYGTTGWIREQIRMKSGRERGMRR